MSFASQMRIAFALLCLDIISQDDFEIVFQDSKNIVTDKIQQLSFRY